jgi:hypothetical protein
VPWLVATITPVSVPAFICPFLLPAKSLSVSLLHKDSRGGREISSGDPYINLICKDPIPKSGTPDRFQGLGPAISGRRTFFRPHSAIALTGAKQ